MDDPYAPNFENEKPEKIVTKVGPSGKQSKVLPVKVTPTKMTPKLIPAATKPMPPGSAAKLPPARRESNRQIKKPKRDLPEEVKPTVDGENVRKIIFQINTLF